MRTKPWSAALATLAAAAVWLGATGDARALTIQGRVTRGEERQPVADHPVQLHVVRGDEELKGSTFRTNARGEYRFAGLKADPGLSYYVATEYENAFYAEGPLATDQGQTVGQDIEVYEVGRDISSIHVKNHHIVIEHRPDKLHVTEILVFENKGRTAYLGTGLNHAENAGARIGLPASVREFQQGMGGDPQTTHVQGRELSSERPIPPGVRPFSFTYTIPLSGRMDLSHRLYFPTAAFVVLLDDPKLKLEAKGLEYSGPREQGGKQYTVYSGSGFGVGQEVSIRIGGAGFWSNPRIYPWLAAPFAIAAALLVAARRGKAARNAAHPAPSSTHAAPSFANAAPPPATAAPRPVRAASPPRAAAPPSGRTSDEDFRKSYVYLIAALDEGLERGEFSRETHALVRQNLKRRLQALLAEEPASGVR